MNNPTLSDYQQLVKDQAASFKFNWSNYVQYCHLVEEVGELGEALTVHLGDRQSGSGEAAQADHADLKEEIGDVLFAVTQIANQLNINIADAADFTEKRYQKKLDKMLHNL